MIRITLEKRHLFDQPKEVVQRWIRIRIGSYAPILARAFMRPIIILRERSRIKELNKSILSIRRLSSRCMREGYNDTLIIANAALYLLLVDLDVATLKADALTHPSLWKRKLNIRVFALIAFEWEMKNVFNRDFYAALDRLKCSHEFTEELQISVRNFRKTHEKIKRTYKDIRHKTIAHRDPDAVEVHRKILALREQDFFINVSELYPSIEKIIWCLTDILFKCGNVESFEKFITNANQNTNQ